MPEYGLHNLTSRSRLRYLVHERLAAQKTTPITKTFYRKRARDAFTVFETLEGHIVFTFDHDHETYRGFSTWTHPALELDRTKHDGPESCLGSLSFDPDTRHCPTHGGSPETQRTYMWKIPTTPSSATTEVTILLLQVGENSHAPCHTPATSLKFEPCGWIAFASTRTI